MIGRGLSWSAVWEWVTHPPAGSNVSAWGISHASTPAGAEQRPTKREKRPTLTASEVRARVAERTIP